MTIRRALYDPSAEDGGPDSVLLYELLLAETPGTAATPRQQGERTTRDRVAFVNTASRRCCVLAARDWEQTVEVELWLPFEVGAGPDLLKLLAEACRAMVAERPETLGYEVWGWLRADVAQRWRGALVDRRGRSVVTVTPKPGEDLMRAGAPMAALLDFFTRVGV